MPQGFKMERKLFFVEKMQKKNSPKRKSINPHDLIFFQNVICFK